MATVERLSIGNALDVYKSHGLPIGSITRVGNLIYTYGMISIDPQSGAIVEGDVKTQTRRVMDNLEMVLKTVGASFDDVVFVTIFLPDISNDFEAFNEVYRGYFPDSLPTRYCVGAQLIKPELKVEIQMVAAT